MTTIPDQEWNAAMEKWPVPYQPPQLIADPGRYAVLWNTENLMFDFDRIRSDRRSGALTAELSVYVPGSEADRIVSGIRVNLTSSRERDQYGKALESRHKRGDWPQLVEASFQLVRDAIRVGEPAVLLREVEDPPSTPLLDFLPAHPTILFGDGSSGKSLLALAIAASLQSGEPLLGFTPTERRRVLFLDYEWDAAEHKRRLQQLCGDDMPDVAYLRCESPISDEVDRIRAEARRTESDYLVVDSVSWAAGDEPEASDSAKAVFQAVRQIRMDALLTAHTTKVGADAKPFGSVFWHNGARATWHVTLDQEYGASSATIGMVNRKSNRAGVMLPIGWQVDFGERIAFERVNAASIASLAEKLSILQRAKQVLVAGQRTYAEIADELGEEVGSVRRSIDRDLNRGERSAFVKLTGTDNVYRIGLRARKAAA